MVVPEATALGGGIACAGGGGGGSGGGSDGDMASIGESSSVSKSRRLSSKEGSLSLLVDAKSLENPEATSSSCCTGCLGNSGKKNLLSEPFDAAAEVVERTIV